MSHVAVAIIEVGSCSTGVLLLQLILQPCFIGATLEYLTKLHRFPVSSVESSTKVKVMHMKREEIPPFIRLLQWLHLKITS